MNQPESNESIAPEESDSGGSPYTPPVAIEAAEEFSESPNESKRQAGIVFIWITLFIDILGIGIVIPVLPGLVEELSGLSESGAAWYYGVIVASYATMQFLFAPILGGLSDRFGRRPILLVALFGLGIDFIIQGMANSLWLLFVARIISGIFGASFTTGNAYIADISTDDTRARNFGLVGAAFGLGFIIGPALGGLLSVQFSLRAPFFAAAGLALLNWLYGYFILPESLPPQKRRPFSLRNANPFGTIGTLRRYPLVFGLAMVFLLKALAQRGLENVFVLFSGFRFQWNDQTVGFFLCWVGVTAVIVQGGLVRPAVKRFGEGKILLFATMISAISFLGYAFASQAWMLPVIAFFGALGGLAGPAVQSLVTKTVDETEQGEVQGALTSLQGLTSIFAPIIFTSGLFSYFTSAAAPFEFPGAPFLLGAILIFISFFVLLGVLAKHPDH
ncbi:TCR/Tet family MFS transporter [Roseiconus lacunae]|uniref:TCR/Tet family MFS transporter n=1 Tax=Roseiconus lacunae TaxID=2605694 RepID=A0ABT7PGY7_9BACT|nr:TCR/Tet family MFS transporter [Roseiconus lacunae]MCD0458800.1 TCR/Tet family MFS transporter [Roseiconus lacunae]MDM4015780.1 TCR/Tet family MFS transporter [Roseiconus lacunae]WRQ52385.1 TCR/Tet family MFS transporter [Stieleria sp. HD01]